MDQKNEIALNLTEEFPLKISKKIEVAFNFTKEFHIKMLLGFKNLGEIRA